ncbi:hypothetical protein ABZP36_024709 [Zizania latifolia]
MEDSIEYVVLKLGQGIEVALESLADLHRKVLAITSIPQRGRGFSDEMVGAVVGAGAGAGDGIRCTAKLSSPHPVAVHRKWTFPTPLLLLFFSVFGTSPTRFPFHPSAPQILAKNACLALLMEVSEQAWPDDFRCPISLEVMTDPVILPSGHTFERRSIQRWLDGGHLTCPVTNLPLPPSPPLIPNHALRRLIAAVSPVASATAGGKGGAGERRGAGEGAAAAAAAVAASSVYGLLRLAKSGPAGRREVLESGAAAVLLRHAAAGDEVAARALLHLSLDGDDARVGLVADGAVDALSAAVSAGGAAAAVSATALTSLATVDVNKCTIGAHHLAIPALAGLLRRGGVRERREAATTLYELCKLPENRRRAVRAGAAPALADLAAAGSARAAEVLGLFAKSREGRQELSKIPGIVPVLTVVARSGNARAIEQALVVLNWICSESKEMAMEAIKLGAFHLCEALVNDDNCKIAKNAVELARTLEKL